MTQRALLTDREREALRGEGMDDVAYPAQYQSDVRTRLDARLDRLVEDIETIQEHDPERAQHLYDALHAGLEQTSTKKVADVLEELIDETAENGD